MDIYYLLSTLPLVFVELSITNPWDYPGLSIKEDVPSYSTGVGKRPKGVNLYLFCPWAVISSGKGT